MAGKRKLLSGGRKHLLAVFGLAMLLVGAAALFLVLRLDVLQSGDIDLQRYATELLVGMVVVVLASGAIALSLVHRLFVRPLLELHDYIEALRRHDVGSPPEPPAGPLPLAEADSLREALVAYESDLERLHRNLDETNEELWQQARHDALTGLANRRLFQEHLEDALHRARATSGELALLFLDLDGFKHINDTFGHPTGDAFLIQVAHRLGEHTAEGQLLARIGGDEFIVLMETGDDPLQGARHARQLLRLFEEPFRIEDHDLSVSASIGISRYPDDGTDSTALIKNADAAVFQAKGQGRNQFQFYTADLTISASERVVLESALRQAMKNHELQVLYQPQIDLHSGRMIAAEALLRWHHDGQLVPPDRFIPLAEETGLILDIGDWVLSEACHTFRHWREKGHAINRISVNISPAQIQRDTLLPSVDNALAQTGLPGYCLELEVTEESWLNNLDRSVHTLHALRQRGLRVAVDDFGTGYSSLQYLKRLPLDVLKVDRSFIDDIPHDPNDVAITRAIIAMSRSLGLEVVAEGVETEAQTAFLCEEGCRIAQGFLYARPMPADELEALLASGSPLASCPTG